MSDNYTPPFSMTEEIMNMVIEIGELVGQITAHNNLSTSPKLRRENTGEHILIHAGSPANYVPSLIQELFAWLKTSNMHTLVKSCIFHYEFEFIHPFADGNGRTGRLWHTLILQNWKEFFAWLPVETMIHENQEAYYKAINESNNAGESTIFVAFMLNIICDMLKEIVATQNSNNDVGINVGIILEEKILLLLKDNPKITANQLAEMLNMSGRQVERIIASLKKEGKLERIGANRNGSWKVIENR